VFLLFFIQEHFIHDSGKARQPPAHRAAHQEPSGSLSAPLQLQEMKPADLLLPE